MKPSKYRNYYFDILKLQINDRRQNRGTIKYGQSREPGNIEHTRHKRKTNKHKDTTQQGKLKRVSNTDPTKTQHNTEK